jgi:hypothetical protein
LKKGGWEGFLGRVFKKIKPYPRPFPDNKLQTLKSKTGQWFSWTGIGYYQTQKEN